MKTLRIGIASPAEMKSRTLAVARGELTLGPDEPKLWFASIEISRARSPTKTVCCSISSSNSNRSRSPSWRPFPAGQIQSVAHAEKHGTLRPG